MKLNIVDEKLLYNQYESVWDSLNQGDHNGFVYA